MPSCSNKESLQLATSVLPTARFTDDTFDCYPSNINIICGGPTTFLNSIRNECKRGSLGFKRIP